jgi:hypothetical protein
MASGQLANVPRISKHDEKVHWHPDERIHRWAGRSNRVNLRALADLIAGSLESHGSGVLADGTGEAANGPASAGSAELAFQPRDGGKANPCSISQILLGQTPLAT